MATCRMNEVKVGDVVALRESAGLGHTIDYFAVREVVADSEHGVVKLFGHLGEARIGGALSLVTLHPDTVNR